MEPKTVGTSINISRTKQEILLANATEFGRYIRQYPYSISQTDLMDVDFVREYCGRGVEFVE